MDIQENRRIRLRAWFANRSLPANEKSYLSQLIGGKASFGEKAARRLEKDYKMGPGYLDEPAGETGAKVTLIDFPMPAPSREQPDDSPHPKAAKAKRISDINKDLEQLSPESLAVAGVQVKALLDIEAAHRASIRHLKNKIREEDGGQ